MANTYISEDGVTTLISLTKNELKKKVKSVNGLTDAEGNITLYGDKISLSSTDATNITAKIGAVQSAADTAKSTSDKIKNAITSGDTALYTSTDADNPLNGTLTPLFATKADLNFYITQTEFDSYLSNFAKKTDLDSYLTKTTAASTYVAKADLTEITSTKVTELWNSIS